MEPPRDPAEDPPCLVARKEGLSWLVEADAPKRKPLSEGHYCQGGEELFTAI